MNKNCFWYTPWKDMAATIDQCYLAETGSCPCIEDCEWYITTAAVKSIIYQMLLEKKENKK